MPIAASASLAAACAGEPPAAPSPPALSPVTASAPATPAGRRLTEFVAVFTAGDSVQTRLYVDSAVSRGTAPNPGFLARIFYRESRNLGGLTPVRITETGPTTLDVVLHSELTELWYRLRIGVEAGAPHRINMLFPFEVTSPPPELAPAPIANPNTLAEDLRRYVRKQHDRDVFSGTVLVLKGSHTLLAEASGFGDAAGARPNSMDTRFNVGSMGKMFTAVAVAQLVEAGRLSFESTVADVLPDYPNHAWARSATIGHLLSHASGLGNYMDHPDVRSGRVRLGEMADYVPIIASMNVAFSPGAGVAYSNSGFALLGYIVERVSGTPYRDYVRRHVWARADMRDTEFLRPGTAERQAEGLTWFTPFGQPPSAARRSHLPIIGDGMGGADGGSYSTTADLAKFFTALAANRLVDARVRAAMVTPRAVDPRTGEQYGYGFLVEELPAGRRYGHGGTLPGGNAWGAVFEPLGYTVIVLSNFDPPAANNVVSKARALIGGF